MRRLAKQAGWWLLGTDPRAGGLCARIGRRLYFWGTYHVEDDANESDDHGRMSPFSGR